MSISALRGLRVLDFLAEMSEPITVPRIAEGTKLSRATAYRVVESLTNEGWLSPAGAAGGVELSYKVAQLGIAALRRNRTRDVLLPNAVELARLTGRAVLLAFYDHGDAVFTDAVEVIGDRVIPTLLGKRSPAGCTASGKILLALQPPEDVARVVAHGLPRLGRNTITEPAQLGAEIEHTRERGYGLAHDEAGPGTGGLSVPVFNHTGNAVAAMGVHCDQPPADAFINQVLPAARILAARASAELGYRSVGPPAV